MRIVVDAVEYVCGMYSMMPDFDSDIFDVMVVPDMNEWNETTSF